MKKLFKRYNRQFDTGFHSIRRRICYSGIAARPGKVDDWEGTLAGAFLQSRLAGGFCDGNNYAGHFGTPDPAFSSLSLTENCKNEHETSYRSRKISPAKSGNS